MAQEVAYFTMIVVYGTPGSKRGRLKVNPWWSKYGSKTTRGVASKNIPGKDSYFHPKQLSMFRALEFWDIQITPPKPWFEENPGAYQEGLPFHPQMKGISNHKLLVIRVVLVCSFQVCWKILRLVSPKWKGSYSNHPFSGASCKFQGG